MGGTELTTKTTTKTYMKLVDTVIWHVIEDGLLEPKCGMQVPPLGSDDVTYATPLDRKAFHRSQVVCVLCEEPPSLTRPGGALECPHVICGQCRPKRRRKEPAPAPHRPSVLLDGVQKLKVLTEAGKVKVSFEMEASRRVEIGRLARIAYSGTANVVIEAIQGQMEMD